jgi:hypothetical protein
LLSSGTCARAWTPPGRCRGQHKRAPRKPSYLISKIQPGSIKRLGDADQRQRLNYA